MKRLGLKKASILVALFMILSLAACGDKTEKPKEDTDNKTTQTDVEKSEPEQLGEFFEIGDKEQYFHGTAEFGYAIKANGKEETEKEIVYKFKGYMMDGEGDNPNDRTFSKTYTVSKSEPYQVVEDVEKNKEFGVFPSKGLMDSIIEDKIVLQTPIKEGTKWEQNFNYAGQALTAYSVIDKVDDKSISVTTTVPNIEGFHNNSYIEKTKFSKGKAVTFFENVMPNSSFSTTEGLTEDDYHFSYSIVEQ